MSKVNEYREKLKGLEDWIPFLRRNSGLPGPRGNLELAYAVAEEATRKQIEEFLSISPDKAPENTPEVFLVFCGVLGIGKLTARGEYDLFARLRATPRIHAGESAKRLRWRFSLLAIRICNYC